MHLEIAGGETTTTTKKKKKKENVTVSVMLQGHKNVLRAALCIDNNVILPVLHFGE